MIMKLVVILSFIGLTIGAPTTINTDAANVAVDVVKAAVEQAVMMRSNRGQLNESEIKAAIDASMAVSTYLIELGAAGKHQQSDARVASEISKDVGLSVLPLARNPKDSLKAAETAVEIAFVPIGLPVSFFTKKVKDGKISREALGKIEKGLALSNGAVAAGVDLYTLIYGTSKDIQNDIVEIGTDVAEAAAPITPSLGGFTSLVA